MREVYSAHELETFQQLGPIIRIHWNSEKYTIDMAGVTRIAYRCNEIVVPADTDIVSLVYALIVNNAPVKDIMNAWKNKK